MAGPTVGCVGCAGLLVVGVQGKAPADLHREGGVGSMLLPRGDELLPGRVLQWQLKCLHLAPQMVLPQETALLAASLATACMLCQAAFPGLSDTCWLSFIAGQAEPPSGLQRQTAMASPAQRCQGRQPAINLGSCCRDCSQVMSNSGPR